MKLTHLLLAMGLAVLVALLWGSVISHGDDPEAMLSSAGNAPPTPDPSDYSESWGPKDAPVMLQACLPQGNPFAERVRAAFREVSQRRPTLVRVEVLDMSHPLTAKTMAFKGIRTPVVAVNGKTSFRIRLANQSTNISLVDVKRLKSLPLEEVFGQIVDQELKSRGSPGAPGRKSAADRRTPK